jgi:DNA mismatch repair protein MutS
MAGLPDSVTTRAKDILHTFERKESARKKSDEFQISLFEITEDDKLKRILEKVDLNNITPLEALNILKQMKDSV